LDGEIARCKRENKPVTVLVCNLDGFERVNDSFGDVEGDKVLQAVAQGLRENCREYDYVARMSGDEFVLVLPGCPTEATQAKVRVLREIAAKAGELLPCGEDHLSMSVGEAVFPADGLDGEQLLAEAHQRMYEARHGRSANCEAPCVAAWS